MVADNYRKWHVVVLASRSSRMASVVSATAREPLGARIKLKMDIPDEIEHYPNIYNIGK